MKLQNVSPKIGEPLTKSESQLLGISLTKCLHSYGWLCPLLCLRPSCLFEHLNHTAYGPLLPLPPVTPSTWKNHFLINEIKKFMDNIVNWYFGIIDYINESL